MNLSTLSDSEKWELLAGQVLGDLSEQERDHVELILADDESQEMLWKVERTAAAAQLSLHHADSSRFGRSAEMPADLAHKIRSQANDWIQNATSGIEQSDINKQDFAERKFTVVSDDAPTQVAPIVQTDGALATTGRPSSAREWAGWLCAAAALLLALGLWQRSTPQTTPSASAARTAMLAGERKLIQVDWTPGTTPFESTVTGDVVWDSERQAGFMRFVGMPVNDPTIEQYQLWIIDPKRDDEPIDGGVFDITAAGEMIIPIDAKLRVIEPAAFAITIEKPGGVVVSTQDRLPLLAAVSG